MGKVFSICDPLARYLDGLSYDESERPAPIMGSLATMLWNDEGGSRLTNPDCHPECRESVRTMLRLRDCVWHEGAVPEPFREFWNEARERLPNWPGFKRLSLSVEDRKSLEECDALNAACDEALIRWADEVSVEFSDDGLIRWSVGVDLRKERDGDEQPDEED